MLIGVVSPVELQCVRAGWSFPIRQWTTIVGRWTATGPAVDLPIDCGKSKAISRQAVALTVCITGEWPPCLELTCLGKTCQLPLGHNVRTSTSPFDFIRLPGI